MVLTPCRRSEHENEGKCRLLLPSPLHLVFEGILSLVGSTQTSVFAAHCRPACQLHSFIPLLPPTALHVVSSEAWQQCSRHEVHSHRAVGNAPDRT